MAMIFRMGGGVVMGGDLSRLGDRRLPWEGDAGDGWQPQVDIYENERDVILVVEAAGVRRADLKVLVDPPVVRIFGQRDDLSPTPGARVHRMEIERGGFSRAFRIGPAFDPQGVSAQRRDGLLIVTLPKI
jgi:HSP20 family protein